jgi:hypothetical protein
MNLISYCVQYMLVSSLFELQPISTKTSNFKPVKYFGLKTFVFNPRFATFDNESEITPSRLMYTTLMVSWNSLIWTIRRTFTNYKFNTVGAPNLSLIPYRTVPYRTVPYRTVPYRLPFEFLSRFYEA